jgi:hypothetical protein
MPNAAATVSTQRRARTRREATAGRVGRAPPPTLPRAPEAGDEDTRGWIEANFTKLVAFAGSAALAAVVVSRLLPSPVRANPMVAAAPQAPAAVVATPSAEPEVAMPAPGGEVAAGAPIAAPTPAAEPAAGVAFQATTPTAHRVHLAQVLPASRRHAKARSHRTLAHAAEARTAPVPVVGKASPSRARSAYTRGDLDTAEQMLRSVGHVGQADRVASVRRYLSQAQGELREHDEAPATRAFEAAANADRALGFGAGKVSHDVSREAGLLHVAAGLRARRAGNEAGARREFEAAHRDDPTNSRASVELQSQPQPQSQPTDEVSAQDAIDPD